MSEFFQFLIRFSRGWRRKMGLSLLVMTCVLMGGWLRSVFVADGISWTRGSNVCEHFMSAEQNLTWQTTYNIEALLPSMLPVWHSSALDFTIVDDAADQPVWRWRFLGFEAGEFTTQMTGDASYGSFCSIPYWSVTVPLTLVSIWFLLSKPRPSNQKNITEPGASERG
jgi:hypothetical protein